MDADAIVVGGGLAGLVATCELIEAGRKVILLDQEGEQSLGGQAFWSFGGLFFVDSPEQRRMRIRDSRELALQDWMGSAGFDRDEDLWPRKWAEAYVDFAAGEKRSLAARPRRALVPDRRLGRARRLHRHRARQLGAALPRHLGHRARASSRRSLRACARAPSRGSCRCAFAIASMRSPARAASSTALRGDVLEPTSVERGRASSRTKVGEFALKAQAVIVTSGGIGGNLDLVRQNWPKRLGTPPARMICGVPDHVDGRMLAITEAAGGAIINRDRMWHYTEGIENWSPIWTRHGIRILPGPSSHLVRRARAAPAGAAVPGLRHAGHARAHHADGPRLLLVRAQPEDHRARVRAVGLRAEPRPHQRQLAQGDQEPARGRRAAAGARRSWRRAPTSSSSAT